MPSFNTIDNGDSGLVVRTILNDVINYVNTGITSGSSFTYITEDTTPGSEYVNILSPRDVYISGGTSVELEYYGSPTVTGYVLLDNTQTKLHFDDGSITSEVDLNVSGSIGISSTDGTNISTQTISPTQLAVSLVDVSGNTTFVDFTNGYINFATYIDTLGENTTSIFLGSENYGGIIFIDALDNTATIASGLHLDPTNNSQGNRLYAIDGTNEVNFLFGTSTATLTATDGTTTLTNINDVNNGVDWEHTNGSDNTYVAFGISNIQFSNTDGTNASQIVTSPTQVETTVTDGTFTNTTTIDSDRSLFEITDGTINTTFDLDANNGTSINTSDGTNTTNFAMDGSTGVVTLSSTDGTYTTTQVIGTNNFDTTTTDGLSSVGIVADLSQFNCELYDDNAGTTSSFGLQTSQATMLADDGTNTSTQTIQPNSITLSSTDAIYTTALDMGSNYLQFYSNDSNGSGTYNTNIDLQYDSFINNISLFFGCNGTSGSTVSSVSTNIDLDTQTPTLVLQTQDENGGTIVSLGLVTVNIKTLPVYADNSAAITGGLIQGDLYRTSTGVVMVRF